MSLATFLRRILLLLFIALIASSNYLMCQTTVGIQSFGTYTNGPDHINIGTLDTHIEIPLFSRRGRGKGTDVSERLVYDGGSLFQDIVGGYVVDGWNLECPAFFVPVLMRETGQKGAEHGEGKEAYT